MRAKLEQMVTAAKGHPVLLENTLYLGKDIPIGGTAHQAGTARFGADPDSSVLDLNCKAHELDNLYVTDASFFPSIGAVNPTLTIIANALRVADHIKLRLAIMNNDAFGGPGVAPTWCSSDKDFVTTALGASRLWATIGHGIINEVYWPSTGEPQIRDFGFYLVGEDALDRLEACPRLRAGTPGPYLPALTDHPSRCRATSLRWKSCPIRAVTCSWCDTNSRANTVWS